MDLRPLRNPNLEWYEDEGRVVLHILRKKTGMTRFLNLLVPLPTERKIELDAIGSDVWRLCDGETSLRIIAQTLAKEHQLAQREAEISVGQFFIDLQRRGYVVLLKGEAVEKSSEKTQGKAAAEANEDAALAAPDAASGNAPKQSDGAVSGKQTSRATKRKKRK